MENAAVENTDMTKPERKVRPVVRVAVFAVILCVILYFLCDIFEYSNGYISQRYKTFKELEPGIVDAVLIGTSGMDRSWIAAKGFDKFGITVYPFSIDAMPCWTALDAIKEVYRYQDPQLVVLDMRMFTLYDEGKEVDLSKIRARRVIDTLDFFSPNRLDAIDRTQKILHEADEDESRFELSYFLSFIQYHSRWSSKGFNPLKEIGSKESKYLGFYLTTNSIQIYEAEESEWTDERREITDTALSCLEEILDYCEKNGIRLLFLNAPYQMTLNEVKRLNWLCDYFDEHGVDYITYSDREWYNIDGSIEENITETADGTYAVNYNGIELVYEDREAAVNYLTKHSFDLKQHFYDDSHLNFEGAAIFTRLFGDYLVNNYGLADHSEDERYAEWEEIYKKIKNY